jgi:hypothetical protein
MNNRDDPVREALARNIITLAQAGKQDPERLCDGALRALDRPRPGLSSDTPTIRASFSCRHHPSPLCSRR